MRTHIRWMITRDMPEVCEIDRIRFVEPWEQSDFERVLKQRNMIGMVVEDISEIGPFCFGPMTGELPVIGYMVYELRKRSFALHRFAVHPTWSRRGVGRSMIERLKERLGQPRADGKRDRLLVSVSEYSLDAQLLLRACGLRCIDTVRRDGCDDLVFRYEIKEVLACNQSPTTSAAE